MIRLADKSIPRRTTLKMARKSIDAGGNFADPEQGKVYGFLNSDTALHEQRA